MAYNPHVRSAVERLEFRGFELRPESGELFRDQRPIRLQQQPTRVLELLARRAGEVVPRDELQREIWGEGHFVDSEQGLNYCVRQIRLALGDEADSPRFVETVPRRGYRFVAPVKTAPAPVAASGAGERAPAARPRARRRAVWWLAGLAAGIVVVAGTRFAMRPAASGSGPPTSSPAALENVPAEAREAYLQGVFLSRQRLTTDRERAVEPLERAIELAPDFAPAHAAWARLVLSLHRPPLEALPLAEAATDRALELDPDLAAAHVVRGRVRLSLRRDWSGAEAAFRRALELDASSVDAHLAYAHLLAASGRHDEALDLVHRARELDPASALVSADLGWYYYFARRFSPAEKHSRETLKIEADDVFALSCLVLTALERGDEADALDFARRQIAAEVASGRAEAPAPEIASLDDYRRARLEIFDGWRRGGHYVTPALDALSHLALGDRDRAFELLDQACREHSLPLTLAVDRRFDPLRGDPRFAELVDCAGLGG